MTMFDIIKCQNIDEFTEWLAEHSSAGFLSWDNWFDENYCHKCEAVTVDNKEYAWCELNHKCKFFEEMDSIPSYKQVIKMWLEREC